MQASDAGHGVLTSVACARGPRPAAWARCADARRFSRPGRSSFFSAALTVPNTCLPRRPDVQQPRHTAPFAGYHHRQTRRVLARPPRMRRPHPRRRSHEHFLTGHHHVTADLRSQIIQHLRPVGRSTTTMHRWPTGGSSSARELHPVLARRGPGRCRQRGRASARIRRNGRVSARSPVSLSSLRVWPRRMPRRCASGSVVPPTSCPPSLWSETIPQVVDLGDSVWSG